jgi:hypothetical protein
LKSIREILRADWDLLVKFYINCVYLVFFLKLLWEFYKILNLKLLFWDCLLLSALIFVYKNPVLKKLLLFCIFVFKDNEKLLFSFFLIESSIFQYLFGIKVLFDFDLSGDSRLDKLKLLMFCIF